MNRLRLLAALSLTATLVGCANPTPATAPTASTAPSAAPGQATPAPGASAAPAASGTLAIAAGKKYHYKYTPESIGYVDFEVLAYTGSTATYSGKTVITGRPDDVATNKTVSLQNGVFWTSTTEPNPVTMDINSYPQETVTVKAGTYTCRKVPGQNSNVNWFSGPMLIKASNDKVSIELVSID